MTASPTFHTAAARSAAMKGRAVESAVLLKEA